MRIVMMGTGLFAEPTFEKLLASTQVVGLFTQPDRAVGSERGSTRQTGRGMKVIAAEHSVAVLQPESINTPEGVGMLRDLAPDLLVVAAYGQKLSPEILAVPRVGAINVHASLLPKYRGAAPIAWAIYHGETETGVTIISMSPGIDAGEMLAQESSPIGSDETAGEVEARLAHTGGDLALGVLARMAVGPVTGTKQDLALVTKAPKLKKEDGAIDWTKPAQHVYCQVRAMHPWPTPYTFWHRAGQPALRLIVHRATPRFASPEEMAPPGSLLATTDRLSVVAGEGTVLEVTELQPAGKKRMSAADFLRGRRVLPGDRLAPENLS